MSSTELFDAASSSWMLSERFSLKLRHDSHALQASAPFGLWQLIALAKMRGTSRLAHSARTAEEVGMCQLTPLDGVLEGRGDVLLPDHRREGRGAVFAGTDDKVLHTADKYTKYNSM